MSRGIEAVGWLPNIGITHRYRTPAHAAMKSAVSYSPFSCNTDVREALIVMPIALQPSLKAHKNVDAIRKLWVQFVDLALTHFADHDLLRWRRSMRRES